MMTDRLAAAYWTPIKELAKWARNPRKNESAISQVARSIRKYGFVAPIVVWQSRSQIVAGHTRIVALESLLAQDRAFVPRDAPGAGLVPVRFHEFADESEAAAYALADNKLSELADWDEGMLGQILGELRSIDETLLAHTGFGDAEIEALIRQASGSGPIQGAGEDPGAQIDRATEMQEKWRTAPGQLWEIPSAAVPGRTHRLLCGDSRRAEDTLRVMDGDNARWCWTDPPYGVEYEVGLPTTCASRTTAPRTCRSCCDAPSPPPMPCSPRGRPSMSRIRPDRFPLSSGAPSSTQAGTSTRRSSGSKTRWSSDTRTTTTSTSRCSTGGRARTGAGTAGATRSRLWRCRGPTAANCTRR